MKKILKFLSLLIPLIVAFTSIFIGTFIVIVIYYQIYFSAGFVNLLVHGNQGFTMTRLLENIPNIPDSFITTMTFLLPLVWVPIFGIWYWHLTSDEAVKKVKVVSAKSIILLLLVSVGFQAATTGLLELILPYFENLMEDYNELMEQLDDASPWLNFFSVVILAPISEELIFRGVILKKASRFTSFTIANILQALCFGLFHMNIVQGLYAFAGGLAMGYVAYHYRTILASIVFHLFFNGLSYIMLVPVSNLMKMIYIIGGIIITAFALVQVKKMSNRQLAFVPEGNQISE